MSCKVASVQKMHRGHPRTGYFRNEKSTTRGDGINRARCPVLSGQTETTTGGPEREKGEGWDAQRCSAPAEISSTSGKHIVSTRLVLVNGANPNPLSTVEEWMAVLSPPPPADINELKFFIENRILNLLFIVHLQEMIVVEWHVRAWW